MKAAKKRRAAQGAAWSDESEASVLFFKQGEANAAAEREDYASQMTTRQTVSRWWILVLVAAVIALGAGVAYAHYVASS